MSKPFAIKLTMTLFPCPEGGFTALCNEIRGAISEGKTEKEAIDNLKDAVAGILVVNAEIAEEGAKNQPHKRGFKPIKRPLLELCETA